jgi:hypothetical protein
MLSFCLTIKQIGVKLLLDYYSWVLCMVYTIGNSLFLKVSCLQTILVGDSKLITLIIANQAGPINLTMKPNLSHTIKVSITLCLRFCYCFFLEPTVWYIVYVKIYFRFNKLLIYENWVRFVFRIPHLLRVSFYVNIIV